MSCFNYTLKNDTGYTDAGWFSWTNCDGTLQSQWISDTPINVCAQDGTPTSTASDPVFTKLTACAVNTSDIDVPDQVLLQLDDVGEGCHEFQIFSEFSASANLIDTIGSSSLSLGYVLEGNDIHENYTICCIDNNGVQQGCSVLSTCAPASASSEDTGSEDFTNLTPVDCDGTKTYTGNQVFPAVYEIELGTDTGVVEITHNAYGIPDRFEIEWSGSIVFNSGYVGNTSYQSRLDANLIARGETLPQPISNLTSIFGGYAGYGTGSFQKTTAYPNKAIARVYGPLTSTAWELTVDCPSGSAGPAPQPQPTPANGCAEVTGTTTLTKTTTPVSPIADVSFTVADGAFATVTLTGSFHTGYFVETASFELLDSSDNLIQEFTFSQAFAQYLSDTVYVYNPPSFKVTGSTGGTTYKLSQGNNSYMSNAYGEGSISLSVGDCGEKHNYETGVNHTIGDASATTVKVVWPSTDSAENYEKVIDAQDLMEFLTGRISPASDTNFTFSPLLISAGGLNIYDEATDDHVGTINFNSGAQVRWYNEDPVANEVVVLFQNVTTSGDIASNFIPLELYKFRIK